jgi:hypothetical protein
MTSLVSVLPPAIFALLLHTTLAQSSNYCALSPDHTMCKFPPVTKFISTQSFNIS